MEFKVGEAFSPEYFELERKYVWRESWLLVGRIEDIPEPGDYFVKDIEVCKTSECWSPAVTIIRFGRSITFANTVQTNWSGKRKPVRQTAFFAVFTAGLSTCMAD